MVKIALVVLVLVVVRLGTKMRGEQDAGGLHVCGLYPRYEASSAHVLVVV